MEEKDWFKKMYLAEPVETLEPCWHDEPTLCKYYDYTKDLTYKIYSKYKQINTRDEHWLLNFEENKFGAEIENGDTFQLRSEIRRWCFLNKMRPQTVYDELGRFWIKFSQKKQLILFKLRWS